MTILDQAPTSVPGTDGKPDDRGAGVVIRRRTIDIVLTAAGVVVTAVLIAAGVLLTWGSNFAEDYVHDELASQNIQFPDAAALEEDNPALLSYAGAVVDTGSEAEAYASYINGHLEGIAGGATYADLGDPEREARTALENAQAEGADEATVAELQATYDEISGQRTSLFKGETLRGLLLSTFAWSTIGRIAGIAAVVSFVAAALMAVLVVLGIMHIVRSRHAMT